MVNNANTPSPQEPRENGTTPPGPAPAASKLQAVLAWAHRGFRCFPLQADSRLPVGNGWTVSATADPDALRAAWTDPVTGAERDFNIGVLTTELVVLDVDVKHGKPGPETYAALGPHVLTLTVRSPSGGRHHYYRNPGREVGQAPLGPGLDVRSKNGYVVGPGSTIDGVPYIVEVDAPIADVPCHLLPLLKPPRSRRGANGVSVELDRPEALEVAAHWLRREAPAAVQGMNGDDTTYRVACRVRDLGASEEAALELMLEEWNTRCEPPWDACELRVKVENAYRYATGSAGSLSAEAAFDHVVHVPPPCRSRAEVLADLEEKTRTNAGAPFDAEALHALRSLRQDDRAAFELLRAQLKKSGCRVTALDDALDEESDDGERRAPTHADILIDLADSAQLFHTTDGVGFADLDINGHRETWSIRARGFRRWITRRFFEKTGGAPGSEALQAALNVIESKAHMDAPERQVHVRVGGLDDRLYIDLGDDKWRTVEIDATGWRIVENPPVRFRRASGMKPMPIPVGGGSIETLRSFLNVKTDSDFVLVVAWALAVLRNRGPYPVIVLTGEQGSAKSTFSAILRGLLDPNTAPLRALPREDRDLFIAANNSHLLAFDNVSGLPAWISDTLCRLATGGGFAVRQLYSDQDEVLFDAARPVILNGIEDIITRPDLADRAVFLTLDPIPEERRRPEQELWAAFELERPRILGVLLDAVAKGLAELPRTRLDKLPRMADFALWATACETSIWPSGTFSAAYRENRDEAIDDVIDADPVAAAVRAFVTTRTMRTVGTQNSPDPLGELDEGVAGTVWTGTATNLLAALSASAGERVAKGKTWPNDARALSGRLRRAASFLRKVGIEVGFEREGRGRTRTIRVAATTPSVPPDNRANFPSAPSADLPNGNLNNGLAPPRPRTVVK